MSDPADVSRPLDETPHDRLERVGGAALKPYTYDFNWPLWLAVGLIVFALAVITAGGLLVWPSAGFFSNYSDRIQQNAEP